MQHVLAFFSKVHEFVQNSVFSPRSARFVIFVLGATRLNFFQQSARVCPKSKTALLARDQHVLSFSHCANHLLAIFRKVHEFVQDSVFRPTSACFVIFPLGATRFSFFQQSARVCTKQRFQSEMSTLLSLLHWAHHFFALFCKAHEFIQISVFSPRLARLVILALGATRFSFFKQSARACTKQRFQPEISTYCHFCTGCTTF